jgi:hypothetical protein
MKSESNDRSRQQAINSGYSMNRFTALLLVCVAQLANAQSTALNGGATVSGVVRDSITGKMLEDADVQLIGVADPSHVTTVTTDAAGRFSFTGVQDGRYTLGFLHPMLDSLGLESPTRSLSVESGRSARVDLAIPSAAQLRKKICGAMPSADTSALLIGIVRDASQGAPVENAKVSAEWLEFTFKKTGIERRLPRLVATSGENGWFAICNVPSNGTIAMVASRGADSTDLVEVKVPRDGFVRRDLYLGSAQTLSASRSGDTSAVASSVIRTGDGRLTGKVITASGHKPIPRALVSITNGPHTQANDDGEWTISDAPTGTRMLEIRSLGFYPEIRRVDVIAGAPPVNVALSTLKMVLDTVRISATRLGFDRDAEGFQRRRRSGMGHYVTAEDIKRRVVMQTSDIFRMVPGVHVIDDGAYGRNVLVRGLFDYCQPALFLNGNEVRALTMGDFDAWVSPSEIKGIEIYNGTAIPPQFQTGMSGCGSIVIWTR